MQLKHEYQCFNQFKHARARVGHAQQRLVSEQGKHGATISDAVDTRTTETLNYQGPPTIPHCLLKTAISGEQTFALA